MSIDKKLKCINCSKKIRLEKDLLNNCLAFCLARGLYSLQDLLIYVQVVYAVLTVLRPWPESRKPLQELESAAVQKNARALPSAGILAGTGKNRTHQGGNAALYGFEDRGAHQIPFYPQIHLPRSIENRPGQQM